MSAKSRRASGSQPAQSAEVITLPVIRVERYADNGQSVLITLSRRDWGRLTRRADEWGMSQAETAASLISSSLDPRSPR